MQDDADGIELPPPLGERYDPRRPLGAGGFGRVILAQDRELDRPVAVKLLDDRILDPETARRFDREARVTSRLDHPHIVRVYDHGTTAAGAGFIIYEYVEGKDLRRTTEDSGRDPDRIVEWGRQIAGALQVAHDAGAIHRDVKPENILRRPSGEVVLCDFGIARTTDTRTMVTRDGLVLGTPAYMAPEVLKGHAPGPAADQFSLAATLYTLLYGEFVHGDGSLEAALGAMREGRAAAPPPGGDPRAKRIGEVLRRALAHDPGDRYPDVATFARDLEGLEGTGAAISRAAPPGPPGSTVVVHPGAPGIPGRETPRAARLPFRATRAGALTGLLLLGLAAAWSGQAPPPAPRATPSPSPTARVPAPGGRELPPALGHLRAANEAFHEAHPESRPALLPEIHRHVVETMDSLLEGAGALAARDVASALGAWLREGPRGEGLLEDPGHFAVVRDALFEILPHVFADLRTLRSLASRAAVEGDGAGLGSRSPAELLRLLASVQNLVEALHRDLVTARSAARELADAAPGASLLVEAQIATLDLPFEYEDLVGRILDRLEAAPGAPQAPFLHSSLSSLIGRPTRHPAEGCPRMEEQLRRYRILGASATPPAPAPDSAVLGGLLTAETTYGERCDPAGLATAALRYLAIAEAASGSTLAELRGATRGILHLLRDHLDTRPELEPQARKIWWILQRQRALHRHEAHLAGSRPPVAGVGPLIDALRRVAEPPPGPARLEALEAGLRSLLGWIDARGEAPVPEEDREETFQLVREIGPALQQAGAPPADPTRLHRLGASFLWHAYRVAAPQRPWVRGILRRVAADIEHPLQAHLAARVGGEIHDVLSPRLYLSRVMFAERSLRAPRAGDGCESLRMLLHGFLDAHEASRALQATDRLVELLAHALEAAVRLDQACDPPDVLDDASTRAVLRRLDEHGGFAGKALEAPCALARDLAPSPRREAVLRRCRED